MVGIFEIDCPTGQTLENRKSKPLVDDDPLCVAHYGRTNRDLEITQFGHKGMLFSNLSIAPARGPIKPNDQAVSVFEADLINPVLVAIERKDTRICTVAE